MKTRKAAIVIGIASMVAGCGGGAHASTTRVTTPVPPGNIVSAPVAFFEHADSVQRALGHAYACTVAPLGRPDAVLYLGSATLVGKARAIVARSPFPNTRVQVGWARRARYKLLPIIRALKRASLRYYPAPSRVDFETAFQSNCPRIQISLEPTTNDNAPILRWAQAATRRYGTDRVAISFGLAPMPAAAQSGKTT